MNEILEDFGSKGIIFRNERGFQYKLAREIEKRHPKCVLFLEGRPLREARDLNYDICVSNKEIEYYIELKYKTAELLVSDFVLKNQVAQDVSCYDFIYDVWKLEQVVMTGNAVGYAILLTNDSLYWRGPQSDEAAYYPFRLGENRKRIEKKERLSWLKNKEKKGPSRQADIILERNCILEWSDYCEFDGSLTSKNNQFRYLLVEVTK
jgi:hypothetical protein